MASRHRLEEGVKIVLRMFSAVNRNVFSIWYLYFPLRLPSSFFILLFMSTTYWNNSAVIYMLLHGCTDVKRVVFCLSLETLSRVFFWGGEQSLKPCGCYTCWLQTNITSEGILILPAEWKGFWTSKSLCRSCISLWVQACFWEKEKLIVWLLVRGNRCPFIARISNVSMFHTELMSSHSNSAVIEVESQLLKDVT